MYWFCNGCSLHSAGVAKLTHSLPQDRVGNDPKLPYILKAEDVDLGEDTEHSGASHQGRLPLLLGINSPVQPPSLNTLLGEELRHINALRLCRSPVQDFRGRSPSPQPLSNEELSPSPFPSRVTDPSSFYRPAKVLIPSLHCVSPLDLSPR